ncbi:MAG: M48 family metalloprotease, partial [Candidatus Eremiobacteraeota bacterium]|nr:M48 family metalloprotease [Candidatus Eremiobacteraeota bacterium]MBV8354292.1 M48 family metalloprotease [Candidatus Eremiobacteraeota bacterium]
MFRALPIALILALLCAYVPAHPALAISTASEVDMGRQADRQVQDAYGVITDPLENAWVNDVAHKLWAQVARKDVPYSIKLLDAPDINAFTTIGGFIYVNEGTIDFAQSDDELAAVIGHETGHNERRHAVTFANKANIASILLGIGALFSPFIYRFGQLAQAGLMAKWSRDDEVEADKYGVLLMTRAGYDPYAAVTFMQHLKATHDEGNNLVDKFFADHPAAADRVKILLGTKEINPATRTPEQQLVAALHNQNEARYNIAAGQFSDVLKREPNNPQALLGLGEMQLAIGQDSKSDQTLSRVATLGNDQATKVAETHLVALRASERKGDLLRADLQPLRDQFAAAQSREQQAATTLVQRRDAGRNMIKALNSRIQAISYSLPFDPSRINPRPHSRLEVIAKNFMAIARSLDTCMSKSSAAIGGIGSLEKNKSGGMLKDDADIFAELGEPLKLQQPPPQQLAIFPSYPRMFEQLAAEDGDMVRAADAARAGLALLDVALGKVDTFFKTFARSQPDTLGDISLVDFNALTPSMNDAVEQMSKAAVAASQAEQLFDMARARQLETRLTMLGLGFPSERYETLRRALELRFPSETLSYDEMVQNDLTPGEAAAAAIIAADTNTTALAIVKEAKAENRSIVDVANARGMRAKSLEIFLGLTYL